MCINKSVEKKWTLSYTVDRNVKWGKLFGECLVNIQLPLDLEVPPQSSSHTLF